MVHAGLNWRMSPRRSFHHVVYFASIDNEEHFPCDLGRSRADDGFVGKPGLPLELLIHEASGATLTLNPTFYLHRLAFGPTTLQSNTAVAGLEQFFKVLIAYVRYLILSSLQR
jgi:hypothetical protein